jgi:tRNA nucleotidyltransferase (CCA-adding enzyme)
VITRTDLLNLLAKDRAGWPTIRTGSQPSSARHRNLNTVMVNCLSKEMIVLLRTIGEVAKEMGYSAYAVGGFVRDLLRHTRNFDLDIVIGGWHRFMRVGAWAGGTCTKFHTAVIKLPDG